MKILVRGTNWIGDAVMTIPAIRKLRRMFPEAAITLQTRGWAKGILEQTGLFDEIITPSSFVDQMKELRSRRFDLAIVFPNSFSSAFGVRVGGAKRSFGYASDRRGFLFTDPIDVPEWKDTRHEVLYYLRLVDAVERSYFNRVTDESDMEPHISLSDTRIEEARRLLHGRGLTGTRKIVGLAPGSTNSRAKRWLPERFAQLCDRLQSELNCDVVLLGSKDDRAISEQVSSLSNARPIDLTGETDVEGATAVLSEIDLLISNDMGLAHLAPAVGTKTIVIFGPTNQATTRPFSRHASVISANVECAPCMLRDCPIDHRCMTRVEVDEVFQRAAAELLQRNGD